ncbi:alpha-ketoacid dehydrogenase subunit alpha/beta [Hyphococcus luteus]|uniref:2-oxoglutarate dehydrogenase E1 component n=1 Tax=Hyphococcus luteus TaxID=2058213 RepID=A0A2S7KAR8_9PROT|nr:alpha-ketoacid dehydrogenase subunit alpha/beta [Marinicaulis flavus]PQA89591.1 transketolase [Marinicaulis flavus]
MSDSAAGSDKKKCRALGKEEFGSALDFFESMYLIRAFEQRCLDISQSAESLIAGSVHLCAGQEAVPVGALAALQDKDDIVCTYRGHGWALAAGIAADEALAEICHRATGVNGGRAGSAMMMAPWRGFIGENSIVGAGGAIACGAAMAAGLRKDNGVTIVTFGDGAMNQGSLHEAFVFAAARNLPVVFLCENNGWAEMTPNQSINKIDRLAKRSTAYGMRGVTIDGSDPFAVRETIAIAADQAREGMGPSLIECAVPRLWGHYNKDIEHYRSKDDKAAAAANDPIDLLERSILESGLGDAATLQDIRTKVDRNLDEVVDTVANSPLPDVERAAEHVVSPSSTKITKTQSSQPSHAASPVKMTYVQAVNEALRRELASRPEVLFYGEDVGRAGGIFGAAKNLQREFGEDRVFDTPIAEAAILGSAVGSAIKGARPIVEIMWADFMLVALDQLVNQAANVRYLTEGRSSAPLVVRTQQGVTPGSCAQHSQSLEALLFHIPGLKLGLPATAQDAYDMLRAAVDDPDPVVLIESRAFYFDAENVNLEGALQPVGGAAVRRPGEDAALITWGASVRAAEEAADLLAEEGIKIEVLDLRWLSPLDDDAIDETLSRCGGRGLILHEANLSGGVGAEISARIFERNPNAAIRRLGLPNVRVPASPVLQSALRPTAAKAVSALKNIVSGAAV